MCQSVQVQVRRKPEMTWHPRSIPAGHRKTRGTEKQRNNSMRSIKRNEGEGWEGKGQVVCAVIGSGSRQKQPH